MTVAHTSISAWHRVKDSLKGEQHELWEFILLNPGLCDREISVAMMKKEEKWERHIVNARRNELVTKRAVYHLGHKVDSKTNMTVMTWGAREEYPLCDEQTRLL